MRRGAIIVDDYLESNVPGVYALGDVIDRIALTPVALAEGMAFVETAFKDNPTIVDYTNVPSAVFSQPPVGTVGLTEFEARTEGFDVVIYRSTFRPMVHTMSGRDEKTMMKLVVDRPVRPRPRGPHGRARRRRDHPGHRRRPQGRRHQGHLRPHHRNPPHRGRGVRHDANPDLILNYEF